MLRVAIIRLGQNLARELSISGKHRRRRVFTKCLSSVVLVMATLLYLTLGVFAFPTGGSAADFGDGDGVSGSVVTIAGEDFDYVYTVNGVPETIRGVGYNVIYRGYSDEERARLYDRDFWLMWQSGFNTIAGWDQDKGYEQDKFDELLLTKADQYGLGVIMPYYLPPEGDYTSEDYRQQVSEDVAAFVLRFKDYPAIRMWGLGNEVLLAITDPQQAVAFASFLVELADMVHEIDPNHPVIYRESEDVFVPILRDAILRDGIRRPWLVYGLNVYTFRINQILANWPQLGLDIPIVVSEFAPIGLHGEERARGYTQMWQALRSYPSMVFGGLAYVWTTEGPEPVDRLFGLLDSRAVAVDESFNQLSAEYLDDASFSSILSVSQLLTPARVSNPGRGGFEIRRHYRPDQV
ncbi:MAG: hypothetical protein HYY30_14315 [Chloroflexi bacterium]|nr:hypothetical protein [Chloroflexota bacterium]